MSNAGYILYVIDLVFGLCYLAFGLCPLSFVLGLFFKLSGEGKRSQCGFNLEVRQNIVSRFAPAGRDVYSLADLSLFL